MSYFISFVSLVILLVSFFFYLILKNLVTYSMIWLLTGVVIVSSLSSLKSTSKLWFLSFVILLVSFFCSQLLMFYMLFELSLIPILLFIIYWGNQPERLSAGLYFLIYTSILSIPFLVLVVITMTNNWFFFMKLISLSWILNFIFLAPFLVKMPVTGLHFWLPKAHVEASTSGSMILAGILLKLGSYGIFRAVNLVFMKVLKFTTFFWLFGSIISSLMTFMHSDLKKIVAYSSVTHMTFLMVGLCSSTKIVLVSLVMLSMAHGWASAGMFANVGMLSSSSSSRLGFLAGAESKFHWSILILGILLVSNASLPPFPSFFPELFMVSSLSLYSNMGFLFIFISLIVCYYNVFIFSMVSHYNPLESKAGAVSITDLFKSLFLVFSTLQTLIWLSWM